MWCSIKRPLFCANFVHTMAEREVMRIAWNDVLQTMLWNSSMSMFEFDVFSKGKNDGIHDDGGRHYGGGRR